MCVISMNNLLVIENVSNNKLKLLDDDPVRPEIPWDQRVGDRSQVFVLVDQISGQDLAVVCVSYSDRVPTTVDQLFEDSIKKEDCSVAIFYTIWSYVRGSGRDLIFAVRSWIESNLPNIKKFVTLSPPTEMARKFHLSNGAEVYSINLDTVNYLYP